MERVAGQPQNSEQPRQPFLGPLRGPVESRALRVRVDDHDALALGGPGSGHMQRQGGLADPALVVQERNDHGASPSPWTASRKPIAQPIAMTTRNDLDRGDVYNRFSIRH